MATMEGLAAGMDGKGYVSDVDMLAVVWTA